MAAVIFDVFHDQGRDFNLNLIWYDRFNQPVPLDGWGAYCQVRTRIGGDLVGQATHNDTIILRTEYEEQGHIDLNIPAHFFDDPPALECEYELVMHPNEEDPEENPEAIIRGLFTIRKRTATPPES